MAKKSYNADGLSATDKALEKFTELMIEKIENLQGDWKNHGLRLGCHSHPITFQAETTMEAMPLC